MANDTQEAKDLAAKAEKAATVAEAAAEGARDTADQLEDSAQEAVETARKINVGVLGRISSDTGVGFLALSVSIYAGTIAYYKFRQAASGRSQVISK